jgi:hypothetical protein
MQERHWASLSLVSNFERRAPLWAGEVGIDDERTVSSPLAVDAGALRALFVPGSVCKPCTLVNFIWGFREFGGCALWRL